MNERKPGNRWTMILLIVLFAGPVIAAYVLWYGGWQPGATTNRGELIQPPQGARLGELAPVGEAPPADELLPGHWGVALLWPRDCGDECRALLEQLARVHVALNKDIDRVRRLLVVPEGRQAPQRIGRDGYVYRLPAEVLTSWTGGEAEVQLIDPQGFRMMRYAMPLDASGLLDDLQRLLRLSDEKLERLMGGEAEGGNER